VVALDATAVNDMGLHGESHHVMTLTVLYDGDCGICQASARLLRRLDRRHCLSLIPLQVFRSPQQPALDELLQSLHALDGEGRWFVGADALIAIARRVPALWPLALAARIPFAMSVLEVAYGLVARNRHLLSRGLRLTACRLPQVRSPVGKAGSSE
jgi:predicted DCC family thiol-disulfide oxidoreductase YuxK